MCTLPRRSNAAGPRARFTPRVCVCSEVSIVCIALYMQILGTRLVVVRRRHMHMGGVWFEDATHPPLGVGWEGWVGG